jgi:hypothetical protein
VWFALAWGAFPALTGYFVNALSLSPVGVLVAAACFALSLAQRRLSTPARQLRRRTSAVSGEQVMSDGTVFQITREEIAGPLEGALSMLSAAIVLLACALLAARL